MKINTIEGSAKIKGKMRTVRFTNDEAMGTGALVIAEVEEKELSAIVALLEGGKPTKAEDKPLEADKATTAALAAAAPAPAAKPPKTGGGKPKGETAKAQEKPAQAEEPAESDAENESEGEAEAAEAPESKKSNGTAKAANGIADELINARKLRDVLAYLQDKGVTDVDAIVKECEAMKDDVPVLTRISNIEDRVRRTLEVMADE